MQSEKRADTTNIMAGYHERMAEEGKQWILTLSHGAFVFRQSDPSLLEFDRLKALMLPFCELPHTQPVRKLAKISILFMQTPHYKRAVELGWTYLDFFGVPKHDIRDAKPRGLLPTLSWSRFQGKLRGIDREGAKIAVLRPDGMVSSMQMWRPHPFPTTVPFWESDGLSAQ